MTQHIFLASATLCGVCLTVIGLLQIHSAMQDTGTLADDLLAGNSLLYVLVCLLAYAQLRRVPPPNTASRKCATLARVVDAGFLLAVLLTAGIGAFIVWAVLR